MISRSSSDYLKKKIKTSIRFSFSYKISLTSQFITAIVRKSLIEADK